MNKLDENDQNVVKHLGLMPSPVEIDTLVSLTGLSTVRLLNVMERLKKKKIVSEKKTTGKGVYYFSDSVRAMIAESIEKDEKKTIISKLIQYFLHSGDAGDAKTLALADLYLEVADVSGGLHFIKSAGDILNRSGDSESAFVYYRSVLSYFEGHHPTQDNAAIYLETVQRIIPIFTSFKPVEDVVSILNQAEKVAEACEQWYHLALIKFHLARAYVVSADLGSASGVIQGFRLLSKKLDNPTITRMVALTESRLLFFQGKIREATKCYDNAIGSLEELGDEDITLKMSALVGWLYVMSGRIARGMGLVNAVRERCSRSGDPSTAIFVDIMKAHCYLEVRKINDAEAVLHQIVQDNDGVEKKIAFALWAINNCNAFIQYSKEKYPEAIAFYTQGNEYINRVGWMVRFNGWCFEALYGLHAHTACDRQIDLDGEIERLIGADDIYTKGLALRYKAFRNRDKGLSEVSVLTNLKKSEACLVDAGAEIELARTRIALFDHYRQNGDTEKSKSCLAKAWEFFSNIDKEMIPKDLMVIMPVKERTDFMINRITGIAESLGTVHEVSLFIEKALNVIMDFTLAMRGAVFVFDSGKPCVIASRNVDLKFADKDYFRTVKEILLEMETNSIEMIYPGSGKEYPTIEKKIKQQGLHSFIFMPARLGQKNYAYVYLDSRFGSTVFPLEALPFLRLICTQIAVGLSNIHIFNEVKELKDRYESEAVFYRQELRGNDDLYESIVGESEETRRVIEQIRQVACLNSTVLILGETGVGKGLVAKSIHNQSNRKNGPFISINLSVLPGDLVASELFGHEKGAFTGANERRRGRFELANGGTIFLDEIGDLPGDIQIKLLKVLEEGCFERLGGRKKIHSDFRVLAATNKNLIREVERGRFRQDLFFRLNVFPIRIAPLRERKEDIPPLVHYFVDKYGKKMKNEIKRIPKREMQKLLDYRWPGNVRELMHAIERAIILSKNGRFRFIESEETPESQSTENAKDLVPLADVEREHIIKVLNATGWKVNGKDGAAVVLGLKPSTLFFRMKKHGIERPSVSKG